MMKGGSGLFCVLLIFVLAASAVSLAQSIGFQITPDQLGQLYFPGMLPPLSPRWTVNFPATLSFPIVVGNRVFVVSESISGSNSALYALDAQTGNVLWIQPAPGNSNGWVGAAYDNGMIFVVCASNQELTGYMFAFSAVDGHAIWSAALPGQLGFSYPPTAFNGVVYTAGGGTGGEAYAIRESDGAVLWTVQPLYDSSSLPALTSEGAYFSVGCAVFKFNPTTGQQIWYSYHAYCNGRIGASSAPYRGLLYADGFTLNTFDGSYVGTFNSIFAPAFWQNTAIYTEYGYVTALDLNSSRYLWIQFPQQYDSYYCAPIVVNGVVYSTTFDGKLYGYLADTGGQVFAADLGRTVSCSENFYPPLAGLSAGAGLLVVPAGSQLTAFQFDNFGKWQFVPTTPCRLVDTRQTHNPIQGGTSQNFNIPSLGGCNIPSSATAYSLNVTAVPHGTLNYLTIWPTGEVQPNVSTMNSLDGRVKANAAIVPAGYQDDLSVYASETTDVILDIDGYFAPANTDTYQFYPLPPCRIVDTRGANGPLGGPYLQAQQSRDFPILTSSCIPAGVSPQAYSLNVTVVPHPAGQQLGYLTVWPKGQTQPTVSTLNNYTATVVANAAIVPAGTGGDIEVYPNNSTDLLIDINGYFAAPGSGGLSLYPAAPCRALDTRQNNGQPVQGELTVNITGSVCAPPRNAQAFVLNATVVPPGPMPYLTLWPDGENQPNVSTLNAYDSFVTSNMSVLPSSNGSIDAYTAAPSHLILDISGYFAP